MTSLRKSKINAAATFEMTPSKHKKYYGLERELELIFSSLGEASTTAIAKSKDVRGFEENKNAARNGGKIAGDARKKLELETGEKVASEDNFLTLTKTKRIK